MVLHGLVCTDRFFEADRGGLDTDHPYTAIEHLPVQRANPYRTILGFLRVP
jgi:hypothetical protein